MPTREIHANNGIHVEFIPPEKWWQRARWRLLQPYTSSNGLVTAPAGFATDGASIPWFLRWRFPPTGKYFGAAIIHDYILVSSGDWDYANQQFEQELEGLNVERSTRRLMVTAVKMWGRGKQLINKTKQLIKNITRRK